MNLLATITHFLKVFDEWQIIIWYDNFQPHTLPFECRLYKPFWRDYAEY